MEYTFITEIRSKTYIDGKTGKKYNTEYIIIPRELRTILNPGDKVVVTIRPLTK